MRNLLQSFVNSPTLFSTICGLIILIGIPLALYWYTQEYEQKLGAAYLTYLVIFAIILLVADRILVNVIKPWPLTIGEVVFLFGIFLLVSLMNKKVIVDLQDYKHNYFMIVLNEGPHTNSRLHYTFPFNKTVKINRKHIVINPGLKETHYITAKPYEHWQTCVKRVREVDGIEVIFQHNFMEKFDDATMDSLIREEIKAGL